MIFSPLDLVFFQQISPKKVRVQSWQHIHIQQQIRQKKLESKNTPKKVRVQPHNPRHRNPFSPRFMPAAHWPTRPDLTRLFKIFNSLRLGLFTTRGRTYIKTGIKFLKLSISNCLQIFFEKAKLI